MLHVLPSPPPSLAPIPIHGNVAAARRYRQRKRAGEVTRKRRSAAELAALEAKPLEQRSAEEKEAVRNHRKEVKRKTARLAAALSVPVAGVPTVLPPPPPATRSSSPAPAPPVSSIRDDSLLLNTADLDDILGRPLSPPAPPAAAAASSLPLPSPPPAAMSFSPVFDTPFNAFVSPPSFYSYSAAAAAAPASLSPIAPAAAASSSSAPVPAIAPSPLFTSAAAAASISSASKLRSAIMKKRAAMSVLNPNTKRREASKGIKIGTQYRGEDDVEEHGPHATSKLLLVPQRAAARAAEQQMRDCMRIEDDHDVDGGICSRPKIDVWKEKEKLARVVALAPSEENAAWASAEKQFAESIIDVIIREVKRRKGDHCMGISSLKADTIRSNVHSWASVARLQGKCTGTADTHEHAAHGLCPGSFSPSTFFLHGVVQFAHWRNHKRNNDPCELIRNRCRADDEEVFLTWIAEKGRFLYTCCHAIESARESRILAAPT